MWKKRSVNRSGFRVWIVGAHDEDTNDENYVDDDDTDDDSSDDRQDEFLRCIVWVAWAYEASQAVHLY